jgi:GNAT superfamily N-acetyltransferase
MEGTEHPLREAHLPGCVALSKAALWNQNEADWRLMLDIGHGWGISLADGRLAASTLVLPYGGDFAWISMVLVLPAHRRNGYASRLLRTAIADLEARGLTPMLDATPAGRTVYSQEGFGDRWGFKRFFLRARNTARVEGEVRPVRDSDWPWILELDRAAFGASREKVLRGLHRRLPQAALLVEEKGFVFGRDGREARQIGPLIASDPGTARALLSHAVRAAEPPLYVDLADHAPLHGLLEARGFAFQRPFTRMVRGARPAPGDEKLTFLVAGPELG